MNHGTDGMHAPTWKWEWSPNTIAVVLGIGVTIAGWGYVVAQVHDELALLSQKNGVVMAELDRIKAETRRLDALEFRVGAVEREAVSSADSMRTVEQAINSLSSDMRLVREILERLERNGGRPYYGNQAPFRGTAP